MIISRFFITGYKNLVDCDFSPLSVCAITGCNGAGKSNLLEVLPFVARLHSGTDENRQGILNSGWCPNGTWFPVSKVKARIQPFHLILECVLQVRGEAHLVEYSLIIEPLAIHGNPIFMVDGARIASETVKAKVVGTTGAMRTVLVRNSESEVVVSGGKTPRAKNTFKCKQDMCALQAFEVREADSFDTNYPVLATFRRSLLATELVQLDVKTFRMLLHEPDRQPMPHKLPGAVVNAYEPYQFLREIESDKKQWSDFQNWLKHLIDIDGLTLYEPEEDSNESAAQFKKRQFILAEQHGRLLYPGELSMGSSVAIGFLTVLYTLLKKGGAALFEEPENYLHPKAISELVKFFREFSQEHTVIFSTHSPVALNSMKPAEVCVLRPIGNGFVTIKNVSEIKEAIDTLNRGFLSFGDLLQTDYATE